MISIIDLPAPLNIWEQEDYIGILYNDYPSAVKAYHIIKENYNPFYQNNNYILDLKEKKYYSVFFYYDGPEGFIIVFSLMGNFDNHLVPDTICNSIEELKRSNFEF